MSEKHTLPPVPSRLIEGLRDTGYDFNTALADMRVDEYLWFRGGLKGLDRAARKTRLGYVLDRCWLTDVKRQLIGTLSKGYVVALAGVAILAALQDALERSFGGDMKFGALVALAVAATPFTVLGIGSAFWALLCGLAASAAAERAQLAAFWRAA